MRKLQTLTTFALAIAVCVLALEVRRLEDRTRQLAGLVATACTGQEEQEEDDGDEPDMFAPDLSPAVLEL